MREFFSSKKFKVILAVIALMFGMMLYSASSDGVANIPRNLLEMDGLQTWPLPETTQERTRS